MANQDSDWKRERDHDLAELSKWSHRATLWVAIGNGGALVAAASKMLDKLGDPVAYLLLPSCWIFAVGLLCAGVQPFFGFFAGRMMRERWYAVEGRQAMPNNKAAIDITQNVALALEILSALLFLIGLIYPLLVLSLRYSKGVALIG